MNTQSTQTNHPLIIFSLALMIIIIFGGAIFFNRSADRTKRSQASSKQADPITFQKETIPRDQIISHVNKSEFAYAQGPEDAPITVVEYFDFMCPFSAQSAQTMSRLLQEYETSPVRFIFRHVPAANIYPASLPASNASLCAKEQGKFLPMYMLLFGEQKKIKKDDFSFFANALGLDRAMFDTCMEQKKYQKWISKDLSDAVAIKLRGTPTWFINGKRFIGAMPFDILEKAIQDNLDAVNAEIK